MVVITISNKQYVSTIHLWVDWSIIFKENIQPYADISFFGERQGLPRLHQKHGRDFRISEAR